MVDDSTPDCDCEMLALRASVLILPLMREKNDSRSRDDPDARVDGASLFDAPDSAVPRRSRFAISDMRSSESRSVSSSSDDETSSNDASDDVATKEDAPEDEEARRQLQSTTTSTVSVSDWDREREARRQRPRIARQQKK